MFLKQVSTLFANSSGLMVGGILASEKMLKKMQQ